MKRTLVFSILALIGLVLMNQWEVNHPMIADLRLSRFILLLAVGAGLSVAGVSLQALFFNPLCDPYIMGVSSAGALGAVIGSSLGFGGQVMGMHLSAMLGCSIGVATLIWFHKISKSNGLSLLLLGVLQGFVFSSLLALWMSLSDPMGVYGAVNWLLGDIQITTVGESLILLFAVSVLIGFIFSQRHSLDLLLLGEEHARAMGCEVDRLRFRIICFSSILVALCVSVSGMIGFVGLVIPHLVRFKFSSLHIKLIPISAFFGAIALNLADLSGRLLFPENEIPLGAICALLGAPSLIYILVSNHQWKWTALEYE